MRLVVVRGDVEIEDDLGDADSGNHANEGGRGHELTCRRQQNDEASRGEAARDSRGVRELGLSSFAHPIHNARRQQR